MATLNKYLGYLEHESKAVVERGLFESEEAFIRDLFHEMVKGKIDTYQGCVEAFEARHGKWEEFNDRLSGTATPEQEDEWMEWETARDRLAAWQKVAKELQ